MSKVLLALADAGDFALGHKSEIVAVLGYVGAVAGHLAGVVSPNVGHVLTGVAMIATALAGTKYGDK